MKKVLITGGKKGIGLEAVKKFLTDKDEFEIIILDKDFTDFPLTKPNIKQIEFDLTNTSEIPNVAKEIGDIDILINNAGVLFSAPWDDYPEDKREITMKVNLDAPIKLITTFAPAMIARGSGRIVNVASHSGQEGNPDVWYGASKAGLINATKSFARQLGPKGIVINAVAPGPIETDMLKTVTEERKKLVMSQVFLNRFGRPEEVAEVIHWLATDAPEYMNGTTLDINNGTFLR